MSEADIEHAIYENAAIDGQFAIAYALMKCALWLRYLGGGDNADGVGAIEFLAIKVEAVADAISHAADSPKPVADAIENIGRVNGPLDRLADAAEALVDAVEALKPGPMP
jgi:hypothetical protein